MLEKVDMLIAKLQQGTVSVKEMMRVKHELHEIFKSVKKQALRDVNRDPQISVDSFVVRIWADKAWFQALRDYTASHGNIYEYVYKQIVESIRKEANKESS